jgi:HD-GYP domain-containing protein (c-di-GMP phosphodiesterase class II)
MSTNTLEALQGRLEHELNGAGRPEDRALAARVRNEGHRLVFLLNALVRASRLYAPDNDALGPPAEELAEILAGLIERLGVVHVVLVENQAYVNDVRLRVRPLEQVVIDQLSAELDRHEVGGVSFHRRLDAPGFRRLSRALSLPAEGPRPAAALRAQLAELRDVEISGRWRFQTAADGDASSEKKDLEILARAARDVHDTLTRLGVGWMPNPVRLRRVVIELVESLRGRPESAALAPFAGRTEGSERHPISVCRLSLMLGRALGLDDAALSDLGVAALLHDVGYLTARHPVRHAIEGVRLLLRQRGPSEAKVRRLLAVLEHVEDYRRADGDAGAPGLFARILRVTEHYDLMVAAAPAPSRLSPATALARMWAGRGERYDPVLLALFAQQLGCQPPGTLLELADGSWGVVVRRGGSRERWAHPVVRIVRAADGSAVQDGSELDLYDQRDRVKGRRVIEPALVDEQVAAVCGAALADAA